MRRNHAFGLALATLIFGSVAGYLVGDVGPKSHRGHVEPDRAAPGTPIILPNPVDSPALPGKTDRPESGTESRSETGMPQGRLAAWLETFKDDLPVVGTGRIYGRVMLPDGSPLAGATIKAAPLRSGGRMYDEHIPLEKRVEVMVRAMHFTSAGAKEVVSDADGRYEITGLGAYEFSLWGRKEGYELAPWARRHGHASVKPDAECNFRAEPRCGITIEFRTQGGPMPGDVYVRLEADGIGDYFWWSPQEPTCWLKPGVWRLLASAGEHGELVADRVQVQLNAGEPPQPVVIELRLEPAVVCDVKLPLTADPNDYYAFLLRDPPAGAPSGDQRDHRSALARDDLASSNTLTFTRLNPGAHRLVVMHRERVAAYTDFTLGAEVKKIAIEVPEPPAEKFIIVRVFSSSGEQVTNATLELKLGGWKRGENREIGEGPRVLRADRQRDGSFLVTRPAGQEHLWYDITAVTPEYGRHTVRYNLTDRSELAIRMPKPAMLTVHVPGALKHPQKNDVALSLYSLNDRGDRNQVLATNRKNAHTSVGVEEELLKFGPMAPGKYEFVVAIVDLAGGGEYREFGKWEFELPAGTSEKVFPMPTACQLTLLVDDPAKTGGIALINKKGQHVRSVEGRNVKSRIIFAHLPAAEFIVETSAGRMTVNLTGDITVPLAVRTWDCFEIGGIKEGSEIEGLGLRNGDKLVAIDGAALDDFTLVKRVSILFTTWEKEKTTWTVVRHGTRLDVTFDGRTARRITDKWEENEEGLYLAQALLE